MKRDPHESFQRLDAFRLDATDEALFDAMNDALASAHLPALVPKHAGSDLPVIYIVGVPRSGTTLLSQLVSKHFEIGYIDNLIARFWMRPSVGIRLSKVVLGRDRRATIALTSRYGATAQPAGPHEFGYFWRRWFKLDAANSHHLDAASLDGLDPEGFRRVLRSEILEPFGVPTVFKNIICGFQAEWLTRAHPRSIFVHVKRPIDATVRSILHARMTRYGSYSAWWSIKPSAFNHIVGIADPVAQVVEQVRAAAAEFEAELTRPGVISIELEYVDVCTDPERALNQIAEAVARFGWRLPRAATPQPLEASCGQPLPPEMESRLQDEISGTNGTARTT